MSLAAAAPALRLDRPRLHAGPQRHPRRGPGRPARHRTAATPAAETSTEAACCARPGRRRSGSRRPRSSRASVRQRDPRHGRPHHLPALDHRGVHLPPGDLPARRPRPACDEHPATRSCPSSCASARPTTRTTASPTSRRDSEPTRSRSSTPARSPTRSSRRTRTGAWPTASSTSGPRLPDQAVLRRLPALRPEQGEGVGRPLRRRPPRLHARRLPGRRPQRRSHQPGLGPGAGPA